MNVRIFSKFVIALGLALALYGGGKILVNNGELENDKREYAALITRVAGENSGLPQADLDRTVGMPSGYLESIAEAATGIEKGQYLALAGALVLFAGVALRASSRPKT